MRPFGNPIVSGLDLIREAVQSPNFQAGAAGWRIARDGSAEFNDLTARGALDVGGIPGVWIGPRDHPDFPPELFAFASYQAAIVFYTIAGEYEYIALKSVGVNGFTESGHVEGGVIYVAYQQGISALHPTLASIDNFADNWYSNGAIINIDADAFFEMQEGCGYTIDGRPGPRGLMDGVRKADGATKYSGTAEALITDASVTADLVNGRTYFIELWVTARSTVSLDTVRINLREDNLAGTQRNFCQEGMPGASFNMGIKVEDTYEATATATKTFVGTALRGAGTGTVSVFAGNAVGQVSPLYMRITDITANTAMRT